MLRDPNNGYTMRPDRHHDGPGAGANAIPGDIAQIPSKRTSMFERMMHLEASLAEVESRLGALHERFMGPTPKVDSNRDSHIQAAGPTGLIEDGHNAVSRMSSTANRMNGLISDLFDVLP